MDPNNTKTEPDDGLTPGERAYMNGGNTEGLVKEGLQIEQDAPVPTPTPTEPPPATPPAAAAPPAEPPAPADDDDDEPELDPKTGRPKSRGRWVSKKALDAERAERQRLAQELGTTKEQWARLEERFKVFQEAVTAPEPTPEPEPEAPMPDPNQDIFGAFNWLVNRTTKLESALGQAHSNIGEVRQMTAAQREEADLLNNYTADARTFAQSTPDFGDAYRFLIQNRDAELQAAGYDDAAERARLITADERAIVQRMMQAGKSPAQAVYGLAKARGYVATPASAPAANGNGAAPPNGQAPAPAAPPAAQPSAAAEIARIQAGQDASLSLSNVGGNRPNNLSIMDLLAMPPEEFAAFARKNPNLLEQMAGR